MQQVNIREILWLHQLQIPPATTHIDRTLHLSHFTQHPQNKFSRGVSPFGKTCTYRENITRYMAATLAWECVPEFNIVRTSTMSCIVSYWSTEPCKWMFRRWGTVRGYGGPIVVMLSAVDSSPWTKHGSRAWSGGTIHGCRIWSGGTDYGGPLVVWQSTPCQVVISKLSAQPTPLA